MSILLDSDTRVLIQGITGGEGTRACIEALRYGTKVVAGVTPGKGGQEVAGVPVYNTVAEALEAHPLINMSLVVVPSRFALSAALESINARIPLVNILTEHIPTQDSARIVAHAMQQNVRVVGPSSVGIISPGKAKIGSIGMSATEIFTPGHIGVISKSGGMTSEIALALTRAGFGQSTAIGIGADIILGSDFADLLELFAQDAQTRVVVLFGEIGGSYEELAAEFITRTQFSKPVIALIAGAFADTLPQETTLGHAGAIVSRGKGSYASKIRALTDAGVHIATTVEDIPQILHTLLI
jgi:succinyl-CoA synthetase alpha subunit